MKLQLRVGLLVVLAGACRPSSAAPAGNSAPTSGGTPTSLPDTTALLGRTAAEHPTAEFGIKRTATYSFNASDYVWGINGDTVKHPTNYQVSVVELAGPDSARILAFAADRGGRQVQFYDSGIWEVGGCKGRQLEMPEVDLIGMPPRAIIVLSERHAFIDDCIEDDVADTVVAHFFDASQGYREVLSLPDRVVRVTSRADSHCPGNGECWSLDTIEFRRSYFGSSGQVLDVSRFGTDREAEWRQFYAWNKDSTALIPEAR